MRSSDQYSNRLGCARTWVERMRQRARTVPARRQVNARQVRTRTSRTHATNVTESLSGLGWAALNGVAPSPAWCAIIRPGDRSTTYSPTNTAKSGMDARWRRWVSLGGTCARIALSLDSLL